MPRWIPTDNIARKFPHAEQPSLNPRAFWVSSVINKYHSIKIAALLYFVKNYILIKILNFFLFAQNGPPVPVPVLNLSLPHVRRRWSVSTEASLHIYSQCSYGQHIGPCFCHDYRGQCWLLVCFCLKDCHLHCVFIKITLLHLSS